jgi:GNAT superfamily N-acetyltransferase
MTTAPAGLELRPLRIPASLDDADAADFVEMTRVRNLIYLEISGHDDDRISPAELLPAYAPGPNEIRLVWVPVHEGRIVGRLGIDIPLEEGSRVAFLRVELLREAQGLGIGTAGYRLLEDVAREHGRTILQGWVEHPPADGPRLAPPTGFGSIPNDRAARFAARNGYTLEQVERVSALELAGGAARIDALRTEAEAAAAGYRVVQWTLPTPTEHVDGYAWMKSRMATDAPAAGMEFDEEVWDADRLARHERIYLDADRTMLVTAAQHVASGEVVAFNELVIGVDRTAATHQEDTLVLSEHRGHRLGMLVKTAGLVAWRGIAPASPRVLTENAEENRPMLDINEAIGFAPIAYEGAWKKVLA